MVCVPPVRDFVSDFGEKVIREEQAIIRRLLVKPTGCATSFILVVNLFEGIFHPLLYS